MTTQEMLSHLGQFKEYQRTKEHYLSNAKETIQKKEYRKASELLWGAAIQEIKGLGILRDILLTSHDEISNFIRQLSRESNDEQLYSLFCQLEVLHKNFYDKKIPDRHFFTYYRMVFIFLEKIQHIRESLDL